MTYVLHDEPTRNSCRKSLQPNRFAPNIGAVCYRKVSENLTITPFTSEFQKKSLLN